MSYVEQAVGPLLVSCAYAYGEGPADPVVAQPDAAVGPPAPDALEPLGEQTSSVFAPLHDQAPQACDYSPLVAAPIQSVPPPLSRVDAIKFICD